MRKENRKALEPPRPSESKTPTIHDNRDTLAEYLRGKSDNFCWRYRRMFGGIENLGSIRLRVNPRRRQLIRTVVKRRYDSGNSSKPISNSNRQGTQEIRGWKTGLEVLL